MEALEVLQTKLGTARRVLDELVAHYEKMGDKTRMEKSNTIMDELNSYLRIKENLLLPFIERDGRQDNIIASICPTHQDIEYVIEHMIQIHVDEPGFEYYNRLVQLQSLLAQAARTDEEILRPWAQENLSDEDRHYIASRLKDQMSHESLPSSGMTIY